MKTNIDTIREAFEAWCIRENGKFGARAVSRDLDGRYCLFQTYMDWPTWQAAWAAALSTIDPDNVLFSEIKTLLTDDSVYNLLRHGYKSPSNYMAGDDCISLHRLYEISTNFIEEGEK